MMIQRKRMSWFNQHYRDQLAKFFNLVDVTDSNADLGCLEGLQFDSEEMGGHIYFYSSGYVGFNMVSYVSDEEFVKDTLKMVDENTPLDRSELQALLNFLSHM